MKLKIVFLGTPQVVTNVLKELSSAKDACEIVAVVSQPPARAKRGNYLEPCPVHVLAESLGIQVLTPVNASEESFIQQLKDLKPDLCVTAAYGQRLSDEFLAIPRLGTINLHPSLLPLYRGAAPVQRSLEDGVSETGVTLLYTVQRMDAGPIVAQEKYKVDGNIQAPELLQTLFDLGAKKLVKILPDLAAGKIKPVEQDDSKATRAKKMSVEESSLDFQQPARLLHNKVRAFAGWPGTRYSFNDGENKIETKIIETKLGVMSKQKTKNITLTSEGLECVCEDGSILHILKIQPLGKRVLEVREFWNGVRNKNSFTW